MSWLFVLVLVAGLVMYIAGLYNRLIILRQRVRNAFAQIDIQLKRRYELIPNLVEVTKGYLGHEHETLKAVIEARNQAAQVSDQVDPGMADAGLLATLFSSQAPMVASLGRLLAVAEQYPELKADVQMRELSESLSSTENRIAFARQAYNDAVMFYNTRLEVVPSNIVAAAFRFDEAIFWRLDEDAQAALPRVEMS